MIFWRILDNRVHPIKETNNLGFEKSEGIRIPDEYINEQQFMVLRTAHGIGDWGIISAMPRLLKTKYPKCRIYVPTRNMIGKLFGVYHNNSHVVFNNNPYVDEFVNELDGEIFHDHYREYDKNNIDTPLLKQILKFWDFSEDEMTDSQPEMYWSDEEKKLGDKIIKEYVGSDEFGCLLISERFGTQMGKHHQESYDKDKKVMTEVLTKNNIPYFYWSHKPLSETPFNFINKLFDMKHVDLRLQLYIKSKAKLNISNQCGTNHLIVRYSKSYESVRQYPLGMNFVDGVNYI
jgi:hypothetical protein